MGATPYRSNACAECNYSLGCTSQVKTFYATLLPNGEHKKCRMYEKLESIADRENFQRRATRLVGRRLNASEKLIETHDKNEQLELFPGYMKK